MNISAKWRGVMYVVAAGLSIVIGILTALGIVSQDQVASWFATAGLVFTAVTSILARLNLTPDGPSGPPELKL